MGCCLCQEAFSATEGGVRVIQVDICMYIYIICIYRISVYLYTYTCSIERGFHP